MKKTICSLVLFGMSMFPILQKNLGEASELELKNKEIFANMLEENHGYENYNKAEIFSKYIQNIQPPKFKAGFEECSGYLRNSAYKLFGKNYSWGHSWNMKYHNPIVSELQDSTDVNNLIGKEVMKPGMIVGFYNPKSRHNNRRDEKGKKPTYTHVALYVGVNEKLEPEFVHLEETTRKKSNLKYMCEKYKPVILMDAYEQQNGNQ